LRLVPALSLPGQLDAVLYGKGYHCFPQLAVFAAEKLEVNYVAAATTSIAPPASWRIDVEAGRLVLMIRYGASACKPCFAGERFQVRIAARNLLNRHTIANGLAAFAESIGGVRWAILYTAS
jgi:hypothetical protein